MNFVAWSIVLCEVLFWIVILLGLVARYVFKRKKLGLILLATTPIIDCILLFITTIDLYRGSSATTAHAIAAVYIGISIAFGKSLIQWADDRFQYYITKQGSKPTKLYGMEHSKHYFKGWTRHVFAFLIGAGLLLGLIVFIGDASRTASLTQILNLWLLVLGIDFVITVTYFIWPRQAKV